jgi:hypothetical protein
MTARLNSWAKAAEEIPGDLILCDVDLIFRADLFKVFAQYDFDIAYTSRKSRSKPLNGGIVFVRDRARGFVRQWAAVNARMFADRKLHNAWRRHCRGMNQPALLYLIKNPEKHGLKILALPCLTFNACDQEWKRMGDDVQVVHLKRALRRVLTGRDKLPTGAARAVALWREYEREAQCEK